VNKRTRANRKQIKNSIVSPSLSIITLKVNALNFSQNKHRMAICISKRETKLYASYKRFTLALRAHRG
jgi:hypothetical protein